MNQFLQSEMLLSIMHMASNALSEDLGEAPLEPQLELQDDRFAVDIQKGPDSVFHVRIMLRAYVGEQALEVLALHQRGPIGAAKST